MSLYNLSIELSNSGDRPAALTAIEQAVQIRRRLANAEPATFEPDLALSLNNLSIELSESGNRHAALTVIEEAVQVYRRLAKAHPAAFEPDLANSLRTQEWIAEDRQDK